jgi:hypothetical protein
VILFANLIPGGFSLVKINSIGESAEVAYSLSFKTKNMIRKLKSGKYRLYSKKKAAKTNKRRNLGTFDSLQGAQKHERDVQYFKQH